MNSSGFTGKFGSGSKGSHPHKTNNPQRLFLLVLLFSLCFGHRFGWERRANRVKTRRPPCGVDGGVTWFAEWVGVIVGSVQDFGNEGLILDECETGGRFRSTECQLD